ncbi:MAG TPA: polysaccharide deacetylase family protein [Burkholderiaceae bacterium]|nr:polysaccharide deacetylase family protein [Burkholderiaceae bacterium]
MHLIQYLWQGTQFVRASLILHGLVVFATLIWPDQWLTSLILIASNHLIIAIVGMLPRSTWLGNNITRLPDTATQRQEIALTIDDGPDPEVTPQVLDLLAQHDIAATFFIIGDKALRYPELCKEIVRRGHDIENHTQSHQHHFAFLGPEGFKKELQTAQATLTFITGREPMFFRAPAGNRNPFLEPVLNELGLRLVSWSLRGFDTQTGNVERVKMRLLRSLHAGAIVLLHDGNAARTQSQSAVILEVLPAFIQAAKTAQLRFVTLRQAHSSL